MTSLVTLWSRNHLIEVVPCELGFLRPVSDFSHLGVLVKPDCERIVRFLCNNVALGITIVGLLPRQVFLRSGVALVVLLVASIARAWIVWVLLLVLVPKLVEVLLSLAVVFVTRACFMASLVKVARLQVFGVLLLVVLVLGCFVVLTDEFVGKLVIFPRSFVLKCVSKEPRQLVLTDLVHWLALQLLVALVGQWNCPHVRLQIYRDALDRCLKEKLAQKLLPVELGGTQDHQVVVERRDRILGVVSRFELLVERQLLVKNFAMKLLE